MNFVRDALMDGRRFRVLTVIDQESRESDPGGGSGMSGEAVAQALERAIAAHGKPKSITVDHGTEFTSRAPMNGLICSDPVKTCLGNLDWRYT
ncbi:MAG: hypothetical protein IRZ28_12330 [Steroidobacteraceae bacterium]|nr:hypothetical protein [Steroidobacteraceae bacterium]